MRPGDGDAGAVEAAFTALRRAENPARCLCPGRASRTRTAACPSIRFPWFIELLESRMPSTSRGSSKQAASGGDHFHGMEWLGGMACGRGVRLGSRDFRERMEAGGR